MNLQALLIENNDNTCFLQLQLSTGHFLNLPISKGKLNLIKDSKKSILKYDLGYVTHWDTKNNNYMVTPTKP